MDEARNLDHFIAEIANRGEAYSRGKYDGLHALRYLLDLIRLMRSDIISSNYNKAFIFFELFYNGFSGLNAQEQQTILEIIDKAKEREQNKLWTKVTRQKK